MLENLVEYYRKADGNTKKKILGCIFTEKLIIEKGRVANTPFTIPVQVLLNTVKGFQGSKKNRRSVLTSCPLRLRELRYYLYFKTWVK
jgi:hypothetical protein